MPQSDNVGICPAYYEGPSVCTGNSLMLFMSVIGMLDKEFLQFCENREIDEYYDIIVVGGGAGGSVAAARLSEVQDWKVLVIEAGKDEPVQALVPSMAATFLGTELDWNYTTTGEKNACLSSGGKCSWPQGRVMGGNTVHNGMMYMRGNKQDYDQWNVPGWRWNDVFPYFKRSEDNGELNDKFHSRGGPLKVAKFPWQPDVTRDIISAGETLECGTSSDLNGEKITGFTVAQHMNANGLRQSSTTAFLRPVRNRVNLHVLLKAQVTRILFNGTIATGVEYIKNGQKHRVSARREIVLSAGAVGSPRILLHSGVGPAKDLRIHGIKVVRDLPGVGKNLQNHVSYTIMYTINLNNTDFFESTTEQYNHNRTGPLSATGMAQLTGKCPTNPKTANRPDVQLYFRGFSGNCNDKSSGSKLLGIAPTFLHPASRGSIKLASSDPLQPPLITQNYLSKKSDVDGLIAGIRIAEKLFDAPSLKQYEPRHFNNPIEPCKQYEVGTRAYWECAIKQNTAPENHQAGTCKMGLDPMAVVDSELRVRGVQRLRVADASVIPKLISGNTAAPIMMIGERLADFVKKNHLNKYCQSKTKNCLPVAKDMKDKNIFPYPPYLY